MGFYFHMGGSHGKQNSEKENNRKTLSIRRILHVSSHHLNNKSRPISCGGIDLYREKHQPSNQSFSVIDIVSIDSVEISENYY